MAQWVIFMLQIFNLLISIYGFNKLFISQDRDFSFSKTLLCPEYFLGGKIDALLLELIIWSFQMKFEMA